MGLFGRKPAIVQPVVQGPVFAIPEVPQIPTLPEFIDKTKIDVRYPLIAPYVNAHIYWDKQVNELIYMIEEPVLDPREKKILMLAEEGVRELINISFINIKTINIIVEYLEKNLKIILDELGVKISRDTFVKIMYYIYRDFVGLNELEPLMRDFFIEDIECNGVNTPIYIVHRKYRNIRTSLIYPDIKKLTSFVEKLAQKCGKYISYASPLLDGSLPDGSRVNAVYTQEISARGPNFTVRKFTKEPWSPVQLMGFRTLSPELLAYLWLLIEHESSIMVIGGTGSGKCVTGDTPIYLANGQIKNIQSIVEEKFNCSKVLTNDGWECVEGDDTEILSMDKNSLKIIPAKISKFWRHKASDKLIEIKTRSGRAIKTTCEHPFFTIKNGELVKVRADEIKQGLRVAVPRNIPIKTVISNFDVLSRLKGRKDIYVNAFEDVSKAVDLLKSKYKCGFKSLTAKLKLKETTLRSWCKENAIPLANYFMLLNLAGLEPKKSVKLKSKTTYNFIKLPKLTPDLFRLIGMVIADGHLRKTYVEFHNTSKTLLDNFLMLANKSFGVNGRIKYPKERVSKAIVHSAAMASVLNEIFEIPYGNKARKVVVPELLYLSNDNCVSKFIQAIVDCESHVAKCDIEICTTSEKLAHGLNTLILRLGILPSLIERKDHFRIYIRGFNNLGTFKSKIGYMHPKKVNALDEILNRRISRVISNVDLIPETNELIKNLRISGNLTQLELSSKIGVSRRLVGMWESGFRLPSVHTFGKLNEVVSSGDFEANHKFLIDRLANSDIFWDEIAEVKTLTDHKEKYVYDLTVDEHHNFLAGNIPIVTHNTTLLNVLAFFIPPAARIVSIEDTRELMLLHENWLPSVARAGMAIGGAEARGEVDLFALLKESFRQRPDYVIVGEVRGAEAYVLFQGVASILGDEEIFVVKDGKPLRLKIKDLHNVSNCYAVSYDLDKKKVTFVPINAAVRHPRRRVLYRIATKSGREITLTPDHSLFKFNNGIISAPMEDLRIGDNIIVPAKIPCGYADLDYIHLLEFLPNLRVYAPQLVKQAVANVGYEPASVLCGIKSISDYYANFKDNKPSSLRASQFLSLMKNAKIDCDLSNLTVKFDHMSESLPAKMPLTDEFLRLLGYYISEGTIGKSTTTIALYNKNRKILSDMKRCIIKVAGKMPNERITDRGWGSATELAFRHMVIYEFLKQYCGRGENKKIPDFIFGLSQKKIGQFLSALYDGDGAFTKNCFGYYTISKKLADDLAKLLLTFGIVARIRNRNRTGRKTTDYEVLFYRTKDKLEFLRFVKPLKIKNLDYSPASNRTKIIGDLYIDKIKSIEKVELSKGEYVYDLVVPGVQNFIGGFGGILLHNSGHPSFGTMHAEDVTTMIKRLESPPINLSPSLVEALDVVCIMSQVKLKDKMVRKVTEIDEIVSVGAEGKATTNVPLKWDPRTDAFLFKRDSRIFDKISMKRGIPKEVLWKEFERRTKLFVKLYQLGLVGFKEVHEIVSNYYKTPQIVIQQFGL